MPRLLLALLLLPLAAPLAAATTLSDFEEPQRGEDLVVPFTVTSEEANKPRAIIGRVQPGATFTVSVYAPNGSAVYDRRFTSGIQTFPGLPEGDYRLAIRAGLGEVQVTEKFLDRANATSAGLTDVSRTLDGTDAWVLSPSRNWRVEVEGEGLKVEVWNLRVPGLPVLDAPANFTAELGHVYVMTLRGEEATPYRIRLVPIEAPPAPTNDTPAPAVPAALAALVGLALVLRRRT